MITKGHCSSNIAEQFLPVTHINFRYINTPKEARIINIEITSFHMENLMKFIFKIQIFLFLNNYFV